MAIDETGIRDHRLTPEEFDLLGYLDARLFLSSSVERFEDWDVSFATDHPDWKKRIALQRDLAELFGEVIAQEPPRDEPREMIFLGASRGSIATYFHLAVLARLGRLDEFNLHIGDYLWEPLEQTRNGNFAISEQAERDMGMNGFSGADYKRELASCELAQANIVELPFEDESFDVVIEPFVQHHLNYLDKQRACREMVRVTKPGGLCLIGDLTFDHASFSSWLAEHRSEDVPYALESFIPLERHAELLPDVTILDQRPASFYYVLAARKNAE
jgi:SAM-dependent methyltransferase